MNTNIRNINMVDYYKISDKSTLIERFQYLLKLITFSSEQLTSEMAQELIYIIDNEKDRLNELAELFRKLGEPVEIIPDESWYILRKIALTFI